MRKIILTVALVAALRRIPVQSSSGCAAHALPNLEGTASRMDTLKSTSTVQRAPRKEPATMWATAPYIPRETMVSHRLRGRRKTGSPPDLRAKKRAQRSAPYCRRRQPPIDLEQRSGRQAVQSTSVDSETTKPQLQAEHRTHGKTYNSETQWQRRCRDIWERDSNGCARMRRKTGKWKGERRRKYKGDSGRARKRDRRATIQETDKLQKA